jgi:hypothetical protein
VILERDLGLEISRATLDGWVSRVVGENREHMAVPWVERKNSTASSGSFAGEEDVAFGLGIGFDGG